MNHHNKKKTTATRIDETRPSAGRTARKTLAKYESTVGGQPVRRKKQRGPRGMKTKEGTKGEVRAARGALNP